MKTNIPTIAPVANAVLAARTGPVLARCIRLLVSALVCLPLLSLTACSSKESDWQQAQAAGEVFLGHLQARRFSEAWALFDRSSDWKRNKTEKDFIKTCETFAPTGVFDFTYKISQHQANTAARQYSFDVMREWKKPPTLGGRAEPGSVFEQDAAAPRSLLILVERGGQWYVQSFNLRRDFNVQFGAK